MSGAHQFQVSSVQARLAAGDGGYEVVHESPGVEVGVYVLVAPEPDRQQPHEEPRDLSRPFKREHTHRGRAPGADARKALRLAFLAFVAGRQSWAGLQWAAVWNDEGLVATTPDGDTLDLARFEPSPAELRSLVSAAVRRVDVTPPVLGPAGEPGTVADRTTIRWRVVRSAERLSPGSLTPFFVRVPGPTRPADVIRPALHDDAGDRSATGIEILPTERC